MTRGLDTIQEESINMMDITPTNKKDGDLGQMYSFNMAVGSSSISKQYQDLLKLSKQEQNS